MRYSHARLIYLYPEELQALYIIDTINAASCTVSPDDHMVCCSVTRTRARGSRVVKKAHV